MSAVWTSRSDSSGVWNWSGEDAANVIDTIPPCCRLGIYLECLHPERPRAQSDMKKPPADLSKKSHRTFLTVGVISPARAVYTLGGLHPQYKKNRNTASHKNQEKNPRISTCQLKFRKRIEGVKNRLYCWLAKVITWRVLSFDSWLFIKKWHKIRKKWQNKRIFHNWGVIVCFIGLLAAGTAQENIVNFCANSRCSSPWTAVAIVTNAPIESFRTTLAGLTKYKMLRRVFVPAIDDQLHRNSLSTFRKQVGGPSDGLRLFFDGKYPYFINPAG